MILKKDFLVMFSMTLIFSCVGNVSSQEMSQEYKWCNRQGSAYADQRIKGCTAVIQSGRETTDNLAIAFNNRGFAYAEKGDYDRAMQDYDQSIQLNSQHATPFRNRGFAYAEKGDYDRAIQDYDQAIRLKPQDTLYWNNRCWARAIVGQLDSALADCNESLRLRPDAANAFHGRALVRLKSGSLDSAISDYDEALRLRFNAHALYGRGLAKQKKGDAADGSADMAAAKAIQADIAEEFRSFRIQ